MLSSPHTFNRVGNRDFAALAFRGVVQFGQGGVAGARVVPAVEALQGDAIEAFDHFHGEAGFQFIEPHTEVRAHNTAANQQTSTYLVSSACADAIPNDKISPSRAVFTFLNICSNYDKTSSPLRSFQRSPLITTYSRRSQVLAHKNCRVGIQGRLAASTPVICPY
jgi:hypothetical protein